MGQEETGVPNTPQKNILHRISLGLADVLGTRLELIQLELEEERRRLVLAILMAVVIGAFLMIGLSLLSIFIVVQLYWAYGLLALVPVAVIAFVIAALIFQFALRPMVSYGQTFSESISQLKRDGQWLSEQFVRKNKYSSAAQSTTRTPEES